MSKGWKERQSYWQSRHRCGKCGKEDAYTMAGRKRCAECCERERAWRAANKEIVREIRKRHEELEKARREAETAAKSLAAIQRELALAAPELAVFRSRFERVQADLSELVQSVATLPEDKQAGARRGLAALLDGMLDQLDQIGGGEDG